MIIILVSEQVIWKLVLVEHKAAGFLWPGNDCVLRDVWIKLEDSSSLELSFHLTCKVVELAHVVAVRAALVEFVNFDDKHWLGLLQQI